SLRGTSGLRLGGHISARVGRRVASRAGAVFPLLSSFPAWWVLSQGNPAAVVAVIAVGIGVAVNTMLGPQCAMLPELFGNRHRYLGVAMAREISAVPAGGLAGVLGAYLLAAADGDWLLPATHLAT